ncbi:ABC transporter related [Beutenbergia cavernae DSM 12333]|uniref:ABC transporter related n=1 Tax=Beutenbergia cavernae (strain ATCC BAA-8 / DSM 12333 / CCUG 43141 / JCM 11478 / NBRC 16432 / NCIMB 13614 / HKI 0122) TaxID=471853 RepID=C5BX38_BEUC1|nr:ABC transporter ATP-binding protein [Beutenbergia cavernae]ACQ78713.1 ABC transporter related [Beutenbergia cavernae DSM 12333]
MLEPLLAVGGLGVRFDAVEAVRGATFDVGHGEFVAVIGPSGCGKSTVLRALAGLLPAGARFDGAIDVPHEGGRPDVAWLPQRDALLPWRRAWANALVGARIAGVPDAETRAAELFDRFGLAGFERAWPHELSGGMRQRLALLRTVLAGRRVLLLDEPFGALDALTRRSMNDWLAGLHLAGHADDGGASGVGRLAVGPGSSRLGAATADGAAAAGAVVLVTHDVDEALRLADRVLVMSARPGRIVREVAVPGSAVSRDDAHPELRTELLAALDHDSDPSGRFRPSGAPESTARV